MTIQKIKLSRKALSILAHQHGATDIVDAIKAIPDTGKFLGFSLALAIAEKKLAEISINSRQAAMSAASKEGVPTHIVKQIQINKDYEHLDVEVYEQSDLLDE